MENLTTLRQKQTNTQDFSSVQFISHYFILLNSGPYFGGNAIISYKPLIYHILLSQRLPTFFPNL